jgi:hypothetical protein
VFAITVMDKTLAIYPTLADALTDNPAHHPPALGATAGT